jgi:hypothetical protein
MSPKRMDPARARWKQSYSQLRKRRREEEIRARKEAERRRRQRVRLLRSAAVVVGAAAVMIVLAVVGGSDAPSDVQKVPSVLYGEWTPQAEGWEHRFLRIGPDEITFGQGEDRQASFPVRGFVPISSNAPGRGQIVYLDDTARETRLHVELDVHSGGILRLRHRPGLVWSRTNDGSS